MAFWGLELKPGETYVGEPPPAGARLRITQAALGSCDHFGWSMLECNATDTGPVRLCVLNPATTPACHLDLELEGDENVLLSVAGQGSIHLSGYYSYSHNGNDGCNTQKPTSKAVGSSCFHKKLQDISEKTPVIEEMLNDQTVQHQGVHIGTKDVEHSHNSGHGRSSEWGTHGKDTDGGNDKNDAMLYYSSGNKMEVDKPIGSKDKDYDGELPLLGAFVKSKAAETDGEQVYTKKESIAIDDVKPTQGHQNTMEVLDKPTGSKAECYNGELPHLDASVKRKAADTDGENVQTEKGKLKMPKIEHVLSDQNNAMDQVDEAKCSRLVSFDESYIFTGAVENDVEEQDQVAGMTIEHLVKGNTNAKVASKGNQVCVRYRGELMTGEVVDPTDGEDDTYTFRLGAGEVIPGWDIGIIDMRVGDKRKLRIPPALGFGDVAKPNIPANSWLVYEVELLEVKRFKRAR
ncbi:hypothetical protein E2562_003095 [Oryza meyeriana var. granulata]|uniref:peptidylprolyl isomerase n=1 Tax=Oryza meyeriana var. granulata TaxID=110450 RepID=A0A6G1E9E8_9ORYZ|nr:hypothetical protein E2562_003095 [Oryza meyeriana var. granulata]